MSECRLPHMVRLRCIWPRCKLSLETARSASSRRAASLPLLAPLALVLWLTPPPRLLPASSARLAASSVRASCAVSLQQM